jgi:hypothetical protein
MRARLADCCEMTAEQFEYRGLRLFRFAESV